MFASLSARVAAMGMVVVVALISLAGLLADASNRTDESFRRVMHSAAVIETMETALDELHAAESGQRGYILTRNLAYAHSFDERVGAASRDVARVVQLTADNPLQQTRAREIARLMAERIAVLTVPLRLGRSGRFDEATAIIASGRGLDLMEALTLRARGFLAEERVLQTTRNNAADRRLAAGKWIALIGAASVVALVIIGFWLLVRAIRRPLDLMMAAMTELGIADRRAKLPTGMGSREFTRLARGYNAMVERLDDALAEQTESERRLRLANDELHDNSETLRQRGEVIELLGGMAHRMQAARTDDELASIIQVFVPRVLPALPGALFAHNNSRNMLVPIAEWGGLHIGRDGFAPDQCWALRRGRSHYVTEKHGDIVCAHAETDELYHCEPLLAGGEVIGVLYLRGLLKEESRFRLTVLVENIASALVNHRLQRSLREQTIRDPLTGLFNRRYMEEALTLEIARASRSGAPLSLVMCDVDHFKRFNDDFGHDAGDVVLKAVAAEMRGRFRDGDVICRFGGEEFTIIAPGTTAEALVNRVETVREAIAEQVVRHHGKTLGSTSMSFGIASWTNDMARDGSTLIQAADAALYQAKRGGRNQVLVSLAA